MAGKILALDTANGGITYLAFDVSVSVGNWRYNCVGDRCKVKVPSEFLRGTYFL
ncbi:hypothetical protein [Nostoc sp.]|uniref:hypothetical protein n=1 Tax=Nostoc sp. TaxID=1180 RepID=UPI002FF7F1FB